MQVKICGAGVAVTNEPAHHPKVPQNVRRITKLDSGKNQPMAGKPPSAKEAGSSQILVLLALALNSGVLGGRIAVTVCLPLTLALDPPVRYAIPVPVLGFGRSVGGIGDAGIGGLFEAGEGIALPVPETVRARPGDLGTDGELTPRLWEEIAEGVLWVEACREFEAGRRRGRGMGAREGMDEAEERRLLGTYEPTDAATEELDDVDKVLDRAIAEVDEGIPLCPPPPRKLTVLGILRMADLGDALGLVCFSCHEGSSSAGVTGIGRLLADDVLDDDSRAVSSYVCIASDVRLLGATDE